ncbi:METHIONYL tRNA SYNTHETASE [Encephalitozoon cuniculi GB-M1]|uniref:Probable methionine--tRNA ligase, cytoplasmic n=2 Tax=Encephalitozoon cuniculi TaxID=6035 RepID=SYMC_ENCCU|nr:methionine--tRNA ligase MES1 [Encephalitozoon cuniculi GB-M1]Q8SQW5.1 RecName: Full=Probable methionine--tRNA ligase, cytoplasmic; AltName: Full=Methionyl-tRNA synthetase; Short=MetRS [Encephalitozoon cuniculi GB-M1]AGE94865.1 methionyl tRNA synthetase [Encephalitozoon cuniculi]KMV65047.1 methionyl-tRNA synthetase [Encephalitozoon cuniculi EcunIII-L]CAD25999.1 METHIONYL tRNA SYNTHETASE [Encephalitozoon cuniculi GB-M1]
MKKFITSALPYVNNQPHLGNIIGSVLSGDVYSRYCKKKGEVSVYICGTDEYGTAIEMEAISQGVTPLEICEKNRKLHKQVYDWFNIDFDYFGFTSSATHTGLVQDLFMKMYDNGHFSEVEIEQFYCEHCGLFLADRFIVGECKFCGDGRARGDQCDSCGHTYNSLELLSPRCSICSSSPVVRATTHLFFDLEAFRPSLEELYRTNGHLWSQNAQNIFRQWISMEFYPRCMTRDLKFNWGVPVPLEKFKEKVFYVWFDAPIGYLTFLKELVGEDFGEWCKDAELVQFMGKDNVAFHTVIFPAMLYATGEKYPVVRRLSATEYLQFENEKFSKSRRHGIFGLDLVGGGLGKSCMWRYYLLKIRPESTKDSNFTFSDFRQSVTADLINNLGNFVNRVLKYIQSKCNSRVSLLELDSGDKKCIEDVNELYCKYKAKMEEIKLREALQVVMEICRRGNEYIQEGVRSRDRKGHFFCLGFSIIGLVGTLLHPFIPVTSLEILRMCNLEETMFPESMRIVDGHTMGSDIRPLFEDFTTEQIEEMKRYDRPQSTGCSK